ncbi:hypothetical protein [Leucobacter chromiireducens]|uniref:hypothetical protein n=1 Tax=Leucobacter chromiireducens TaxID=283877 RepID=UPI001928BE20|nr:hypothetical protein [Leucobacter chromiireducens]
MSVPETPGPDLSQLPPPPLPGNASLPDPSLSELPPPDFSTDTQKVTEKPRHLGIIVTAATSAVVLVGAVVAVLVFTPFSSSPGTSEQPDSAPTARVDSDVPEVMPVTPTPGETEPQPTTESAPTLEVPGSGAAPIPEEATKLCVYGTTKEVEVYLFENSNTASGDWIYVGGNADLGYLTLPAKAVYFPGGGVSGHRMTNADGTEYYLTGHELTVTPANGEGFYQIVRSWEQYGC